MVQFDAVVNDFFSVKVGDIDVADAWWWWQECQGFFKVSLHNGLLIKANGLAGQQ